MRWAASVWMPVLLVTIYLLGSTRGQVGTILETTTETPANDTGPTPTPKFNCIVCDDLKDNFCEPWDHFSHSKDCYQDSRIDKSKPVGCRKMVQTIQSKTYVSRQCTNIIDSHVQGCIDRVGTKKIKVLYCHCRTQDCNAAGRLASGSCGWTALALLAPALLAALGAR